MLCIAEKNVNVSFPDFALLSGGLRGAFPWLTIERHHEKIQNICIILMEIWCENVYGKEQA
jgi:hypothetical protein